MNRIFAGFLFSFLLFGCKSKKAKRPEVSASDFFPVPTYIRGELKRMDSSLMSFTKIETVDGRSDTTPIKSTDVSLYAKDFLALPDISSSELKDDYDVSPFYDESQKASVLTFMTQEAHPVQQEIVTVDENVNAQGKNDIRSVYVNLVPDSTVSIKKILMWEASKGFYTTTVIRTPDGKEQIKKVEVVWNGFDDRNP